jgi:hypothetical protein
MTPITLTRDQLEGADDMARFGCPLSEAELDEYIANKNSRVFVIRAIRGNQREEHLVLADSTSQAARIAFDRYGLPGAYVGPA